MEPRATLKRALVGAVARAVLASTPCVAYGSRLASTSGAGQYFLGHVKAPRQLLGHESLQGSPLTSQGGRAGAGPRLARGGALQEGARGHPELQACHRAGGVPRDSVEVGVDLGGRRIIKKKEASVSLVVSGRRVAHAEGT